jgi:hypothetical protein
MWHLLENTGKPGIFRMSQSNTSHAFDEVQWTEEQHKRYGPIIGGEALRVFLGFRTYAAFQKARRHNDLEVPVFSLQGRQGHFAMTAEACAWLIAQRRAGCGIKAAQDNNVTNEANEEMHPCRDSNATRKLGKKKSHRGGGCLGETR